MSRKYYLCIITKNKCSACDEFKATEIEKVRRRGESVGITVKFFNFVDGVLPANSEPMPDDLRHNFYWVPAAVLAEKESYDASMRDKNVKIVAYPFNVKFIPGVFPPPIIDTSLAFNEVNIFNWVNSIVGKPTGTYEPPDMDFNAAVCANRMGSRNFRFGV